MLSQAYILWGASCSNSCAGISTAASGAPCLPRNGFPCWCCWSWLASICTPSGKGGRSRQVGRFGLAILLTVGVVLTLGPVTGMASQAPDTDEGFRLLYESQFKHQVVTLHGGHLQLHHSAQSVTADSSEPKKEALMRRQTATFRESPARPGGAARR